MISNEVAEASANSFSEIEKINTRTINLLERLSIRCNRDLLFHWPLRYEDRTTLQDMGHLTPGVPALVEGIITKVNTPFGGKTRLLCILQDGAKQIALRFFHVLPFHLKMLTMKSRVRCFGTVQLTSFGLEMVHPEFHVIFSGQKLPLATHLTPVYPTTAGLSQNRLRELVDSALALMWKDELWQELLTQTFLDHYGFPPLPEAIQLIHKPSKGTHPLDLLQRKTVAQRRLIYDELLAYRVSMMHCKKLAGAQKCFSLPDRKTLSSVFLSTLPFELTKAQQKVLKEIKKDIKGKEPMLRLLQGDVGSGKTIVAALTMLTAVENGHQAALMVPTELLAEQHFQNFHRWFTPLGLQVVLLTGQVKAKKRKELYQDLKSGKIHIIIGTHALYQEDVSYANLALIVIDEQHRFGVQQRAVFREKGLYAGRSPHQLVMTATPIPRTLAMSFYADLACSTIDELPAGRIPIATSVLSNNKRSEILHRIDEACQSGRQVYWVCPLIEESETLASQAAVQVHQELLQLLPHWRIGLVHGKLPAEEKIATMQAFKNGDIKILVATTVIEVGVDVANANVIVIENAERLGLAQLHQLRGRVGRGHHSSYCILLYQAPLSAIAEQRLQVMRQTCDGFKIAQKDLELRGAGEVLGTKQTGMAEFHIADLAKDGEFLSDICRFAELLSQENADCIQVLMARWFSATQTFAQV